MTDSEIDLTPTEAAAHDYLVRTAQAFRPARAAELMTAIIVDQWPLDALDIPRGFDTAEFRSEVREQASTQWGAL